MGRRVPAIATAVLAVLAATAAACSLVATPATPAPTQSPSPAPSALAFPRTNGVVVAGRYASDPPFDVPFTFEVPADGWESMHLHAEFFDIGRFAAEERQTAPIRWIAFGHPAYIRGDEEAPAAGLTPEAAATLLSSREDLVASAAVPYSFAGRDGVRLDLHAPQANTPIFGGPDGAFNLEPSIDIRLGIVPLEEDLLLVFVGAPLGELDAAWDEALPILESVDL
jgi:hypothetical protein